MNYSKARGYLVKKFLENPDTDSYIDLILPLFSEPHTFKISYELGIDCKSVKLRYSVHSKKLENHSPITYAYDCLIKNWVNNPSKNNLQPLIDWSKAQNIDPRIIDLTKKY